MESGVEKQEGSTENRELACEETIMNEKERFGRVRTCVMKKLRKEHGEKLANRVLSRINKRVSGGSLRIKFQYPTS